MMFAALNLLAFAFHTVCDCLEDLWLSARTAKRARVRFFEHVRTLSAYLVFPSWKILMQTLITNKPPPRPPKNDSRLKNLANYTPFRIAAVSFCQIH